MDEPCRISAQHLDCIKIARQLKLPCLKSLTFWGHINYKIPAFTYIDVIKIQIYFQNMLQAHQF